MSNVKVPKMMSLRGVVVFRTYLGFYEVFFNIKPDMVSEFTQNKFISTKGYYLQSSGMLPSEFKSRLNKNEFGDVELIKFYQM